jgi:hypothetical protein
MSLSRSEDIEIAEILSMYLNNTYLIDRNHSVETLDYLESIAEGIEFPRILVFYDGIKYWLADGFNFFQAAQQSNLKTLPVEIRRGTERDAKLHSLQELSQHGVKYYKRLAILTLLQDSEWGKWSDLEIANFCNVRIEQVTYLRLSLNLPSEIDP